MDEQGSTLTAGTPGNGLSLKLLRRGEMDIQVKFADNGCIVHSRGFEGGDIFRTTSMLFMDKTEALGYIAELLEKGTGK